jgi:soluble lytic murein transglycosylase
LTAAGLTVIVVEIFAMVPMKIALSAPVILISLVALFGASSAHADVYMYQDKDGVINFTNAPTHAGYRRVMRENSTTYGPATVAANPANGYDEVIQDASSRHSLDADLIRAVIKAESDFNSNARSNKGAMGLMQLMPDTARLLNVPDAYNPYANIDGGVRYLKMLLGRYQGDVTLSLAAYNAGSGAVDKHGGVPPYAETREYVRRVLQFWDQYRAGGLQLIQQARR